MFRVREFFERRGVNKMNENVLTKIDEIIYYQTSLKDKLNKILEVKK